MIVSYDTIILAPQSLFPEISTATASRDLAKAVQKKLITVAGKKSQSRYKIT